MITVDSRPTIEHVARQYQEVLSYREWQALKRLRQLINTGADMIIIEVKNGEPRVRAVGKVEG